MIKKFPKVLLSFFATKAQLRNMNKIYEHIERCFNNGFLYLVGNEVKMFKIEEKLLLSDFISLCFPPAKAIQILKSVTGEALDKQHFVAQSRNSSIRGNKKNSDLIIKLICSKILSLNDTNEISIHERIVKILQCFISDS